MQIIKIQARENGAHDNQTYFGVLPEGWALLPDELGELENFPFGDVTVEGVNGVAIVTSWTPGAVPEPVEPEPETPDVTTAEMAAAILEGVNDV